MDIYVARQPILNEQQKTIAYELLFRNGFENSFPDINADTATFRLLSNTFFSMGINWISRKKPVFINFPQNLIECEIPLFFPTNNMVIEILESVRPDPKVINALIRLKAKGLRIALDDFVYRKDLLPLINQADIIKFDLRQSSMNEIGKMILLLSNLPKIKFLAEKVETHDEFQKALDLGCHYFQGYFFEKPKVLMNKSIPVVKINLIRLIAQVVGDDMDFLKLAQLIREDVSMSFRLLKLINSPYYRRQSSIDSVKDAVTVMGEREIKQFILLVASAGLAAEKPEEMITTSIITGRMCEILAKKLKVEFSDEEMFTLGLFRNLDAMLDMPMDKILKDIPLAPRIKQALMGNNDKVYRLFGIINDFIRGDWGKAALCSESLCLLPKTIKDAYHDAVTMADAFLDVN